MADNKVAILLTANDQTKAAFDSAQSGMEKLKGAAGSLNSALAGIGVSLSIGAFAGFVKSSIDAADNLNDLSKKSGIAVDNLAGLQLVVDKSGTTMEMLAGGVAKLNKTMGEASLGGKEQQQVLRDLGITASDPMEAFYQLADAFGNFKDEGQKAAAMSKVIGKTWTELAPALAEGGAGLRAMVEDGKKLNPVTQEMAERADKFNDALARVKTEAAGVGTSIANDLLPGMNEILARWNDAITLSKQHGGFISLIMGGINPTGDNATNLRNVREEIAAINLQLKDAGTVQGDIAGINGDKLRARLGELNAIYESLLKIQQRQALGDNDRLGTGDYKTPKAPGQSKIELTGMSEAIKKAFDITPMDAFLAKFRDNRQKITAEWDKLKADLTGANKLPDEVKGIDVQNEIALAREKLVRGDATGAQAGIDRGRELLKKASEQGETSITTGYLADQLKGLDLQMNAKALESARSARDLVVREFEALQSPKLKISLDVDEAKSQAKAIIQAVQEELTANPLALSVSSRPTASTSEISWSNPIRAESLKRGGE